MESLNIPESCRIDGTDISLENDGDIVVVNQLVPRLLMSSGGSITYHPQGPAEVPIVEAPQGKVEVQGAAFRCDQIKARDAKLRLDEGHFKDIQVEGVLNLEGKQLDVTMALANSVKIQGDVVKIGTLEVAGELHIKAGKLIAREIKADSVVIHGSLESKKLTAATTVKAESGHVAIKWLSVPEFTAADSVTGIVMVATTKVVRASGVRGFIQPDELNMLTSDDTGEHEPLPVVKDESQYNTTDLEAMANEKPATDGAFNTVMLDSESTKQQDSSDAPATAEADVSELLDETPVAEPDLDDTDPGEPEPGNATVMMSPKELKEKLAEAPDVDLDEAANADWDEPVEDGIDEPSEQAEPQDMHTVAIPSAELSENYRLSDSFDTVAMSPDELLEDPMMASEEAVSTLPSDDIEEPAIETLDAGSVDQDLGDVEELSDIEELDVEALDDVEAITTDELDDFEDLDVTDLDDNSLDDVLEGDDLEYEELDEVESPDVEPSDEALSRDSDSFSLPEIAPHDLNAEDFPDEVQGDPAFDSSATFDAGELEELDDVPSVDSFEEIGEIDPLQSLDVAERPPTGEFDADDILGDALEDNELADTDPDEDPEDVAIRDMRGILNEVRALFPDDNYPQFINQISRYLDERRLKLFYKESNRNAVLSSFDKFNHEQISALARKFFARVDELKEQ